MELYEPATHGSEIVRPRTAVDPQKVLATFFVPNCAKVKWEEIVARNDVFLWIWQG